MSTKIDWTDETWNPVRGCSRVSPGCDHCFAMRQAHRMNHPGGAYEGLTRWRTVASIDDGAVDCTAYRCIDWSGEVRFVAEKLVEPLRWRKPRRVFVNSMSDLFHPKVTDEQIAAVFGAMAASPHVYQVLTKRSERAPEWFQWAAKREAYFTGYTLATGWPLPNVWFGVTCESPAFRSRLDDLRRTPAAVRFVSFEPLLALTRADLDGIDWAIAGCESGPGARPADVSWFRSLRDQCVEAGVPYFLKQMTVDGRLVKMPPLDGQVWDQLPQPEQEQTR